MLPITVRDTAPGGVQQSGTLIPGVPWVYKGGRFGTEPFTYSLAAMVFATDLGAGDIGWVATQTSADPLISKPAHGRDPAPVGLGKARREPRNDR